MGEELLELPKAQYHRFETWDVSPNVCALCGQLPQAHPSPELLQEREREEAS